MPYQHQARAVSGKTDCVGVLEHVANRLGIDDALEADVRDYPMETDGSRLLGILGSVCERSDEIQSGAVLVFRRGRRIWHTAVCTQVFPTVQMIHAWSRRSRGVVREQEVDAAWLRQLHSVWRLA